MEHKPIFTFTYNASDCQLIRNTLNPGYFKQSESHSPLKNRIYSPDDPDSTAGGIFPDHTLSIYQAIGTKLLADLAMRAGVEKLPFLRGWMMFTRKKESRTYCAGTYQTHAIICQNER
jgi:hypothetical protein